MKISQCVTHFFNYQRMNVKKNTLRNYEFILDNFQNHFGDIELSSITSEGILAFMSEVSYGKKQNTKKLRFYSFFQENTARKSVFHMNFDRSRFSMIL